MSRIPFDRVNWITSSFLFGTALVAAIVMFDTVIRTGAVVDIRKLSPNS